MPSVSIVMPVYNVEQYLEKCLQSVVDQTLKDIEIICINDGSTDRSKEILEKFAIVDNRIKIINKTNSGYGHSMNIGITQATGEYIGVVETDDYILPEMFETLYRIAKEFDLDFIKSDHYKFEVVNGKEIKEYYKISDYSKYYNRVIDPQKETGVFDLIMMTWSGIYKRSFLNDKNIRHNESPGASFQDNGFWFQVFTQANKAYFIDKAFYMLRRDNPNSSVKSKNKVYTMCTEYDFIWNFLSKDLERREKYKFIYQYHRCKAYHFTLKRISDEFILEFLKRFSDDFKKPLEDELLVEEWFNPLIWKYTNMIIKDPVDFYCRKYYNPELEDRETDDIKLRYYQIKYSEMKSDIRKIKKSYSYRIGYLISFSSFTKKRKNT